MKTGRPFAQTGYILKCQKHPLLGIYGTIKGQLKITTRVCVGGLGWWLGVYNSTLFHLYFTVSAAADVIFIILFFCFFLKKPLGVTAMCQTHEHGMCYTCYCNIILHGGGRKCS